jgi:hypothetical protein
MDRVAVAKRAQSVGVLGFFILLFGVGLIAWQATTWSPQESIILLAWALAGIGGMLIQAGVVGWVVSATSATQPASEQTPTAQP